LAAFVKSVERLTVTITGTSLTGTASTSLSQDATKCILFTTQKTPRTTNESYGPRQCRASISGSTVTCTRGVGTSIGTITVHVTVVECTDACLVQSGTTTIASGSTSNSSSLATTLTDRTRAFLVFSASTAYNAGDTSVATHPLCRGQIPPAGDRVTFTRVQSTSSVTAQWYVVECFSDEFTVQSGSFTVSNSAETASATISAVNLAESFLITSLSSANTDDWTNAVGRSFLGSTTTVNFSRGNGGSSGAFSLTVEYQAVSMSGGTVQRGNHTITTTTASSTITAVDLDAAIPWSPGLYGMGEGNSSDGDDVGQFWAMVRLVDEDTVESSVETDATTGQYSWEVIEVELESAAGDTPLSATASGLGAATVVFGVDLPISVTAAGVGAATTVFNMDLPFSATAAGVGAASVVFDIDLPISVTAAGVGSAAVTFEAIDIPLVVLASGTGAASGIFAVDSSIVLLAEGVGSASVSFVEDTESAVEIVIQEIESVLVLDPMTEEQYMSVLNIWNVALARLGQPPVDDAPTSDGSATGDLLASNWSEFKEQFLRKSAWDGAKKTALLVTFKHADGITAVAPVSPNRWTFCYALPSDHVRSLRLNGLENQSGLKSLDGTGLWEEETAENDAGTVARCLYARDAPAYLEYVFLVPDSKITIIPADMRWAMAKEFAAHVAPFFGKTESDLLVLERHAEQAVDRARRSDDQTGAKPTHIDRSIEQSFW
jgi:hypothetical protein